MKPLLRKTATPEFQCPPLGFLPSTAASSAAANLDRCLEVIEMWQVPRSAGRVPLGAYERVDNSCQRHRADAARG